MKISYPEALPVSRRRADIRRALDDHRVVIVCGDTGSGKTTQLPKIVLEAGRGVDGMRVGCTQPRRIAATSVARRVAEELQVSLGGEVGYQIRFEDRTEPDLTVVKFMTDGILLAETRGDPDLRQYDTLIIDEAHERSLNIDFILGYLHRLLRRRADLKVIISSATLDAALFSEFFDGAPVVEVEGRTYPVEDVYHPPLRQSEPIADQVARSAEWLAELDPLGDTLVFLPGEREIRDAAELLEGRRYPNTIVLPLFARLAGESQQAVFKPTPTRRRIILATNIAETSLTIPDIRFVIDSGLARVNRFDPRSGIQRLLIEPVSQASARQRRGRCGRVTEGVCVRLYSEEEYEGRKEFSDPEILRSNLAGVVLQMEHLGLGDPLKFPFVNRPQAKRVTQAYRTLEELGAISRRGRHSGLTRIGRTLARLPVDPRIGRILIAASDEGCLREGLVIASALAVQDPRERPQEKREQAQQAHAKFRDKRSDFTGWLRWWFSIQQEIRVSRNALRRFCRKHFVNYRRLQEWINLHRELRDVLRELRWKVPAREKVPTDPVDTYSESLHRAILTGIPSHIGVHQGKKKGYKGAGGSEFFIFPGSGLSRSAPSWVMAFEIVETSRLYARDVALLDPAWFEKVAPHLCRYRYSNPHWVKEQGAVYGEETVIAFGLPVIEKRRVHYGRIDRSVAREIFILDALVNGETRAPLPVLAGNRKVLETATLMEEKLRRKGGLIHPEAIADFYRERLPADICTQKEFEKWASSRADGILELTLEDCIVPIDGPLEPECYPDALVPGDSGDPISLTYVHDSGGETDGITATIPISELPHIPDWFGDWLVPGYQDEKLLSLYRIIPKEWRMSIPTQREVVNAFLRQWEGYEPQCYLSDALLEFLTTEYGVAVSPEALDLDRLPTYLRMRFVVVADDGSVLASGRDLAFLKQKLSQSLKDRFSLVSRGKFEIPDVADWVIGDLPPLVEIDQRTDGYPALFGAGGRVGLKLWPNAHCAERQHRLGVALLFRRAAADVVQRLEKLVFSPTRARAISTASHHSASPKRHGKDDDGFGSLQNLFGKAEPKVAKTEQRVSRSSDEMTGVGVGLSGNTLLLLAQLGSEPGRNRRDLISRILMDVLGNPRSRSDWNRKLASAKSPELFAEAERRCSQVTGIVEVAGRVARIIDGAEEVYAESLSDCREHLDHLLTPGWLLEDQLDRRLKDFRGLELRLTRMLGSPPAKDLAKLERYRSSAMEVWSDQSECECGTCFPKPGLMSRRDADLDLRLVVFAQELRRN